MAKTPVIGATGTAELRVEERHTLLAFDPKLPPVLSTPHMIGWMEVAAANALLPYLEGDEVSVGTAINIEHTAACGAGALLKTEAVLERVEGKQHVFRVTAVADWNGQSFEVGKGTVSRAIVSVGRFMKKFEAMAAPKA